MTALNMVLKTNPTISSIKTKTTTPGGEKRAHVPY